jgi:hypothetical protein
MALQSVIVVIGVLVAIILPLQAKSVPNADPLTTSPSPSSGYVSCSYVGDPHLLSFSQPYNQYHCTSPGWELLLSNQYVTLYVLVDSINNYYIRDYMLIFPEPASCTVGSSTNPLPCTGSNSPVSSSTVGNSYIHFHNTHDLTIKIDSNGPYYDFYIWQTPELVDKSCGVCVKWNCIPEPRWMTPNPAIPKICDIFIAAAQAHANSPIDQRAIDVGRTLCINDMQMTMDHQVARSAVTRIMQDGIKDLIGKDDSQSVFEKNEESKQAALTDAIMQTNELLKNSDPVCNSEKKCLQPITADATDAAINKRK